jgi:hypothetical protein
MSQGGDDQPRRTSKRATAPPPHAALTATPLPPAPQSRPKMCGTNLLSSFWSPSVVAMQRTAVISRREIGLLANWRGAIDLAAVRVLEAIMVVVVFVSFQCGCGSELGSCLAFQEEGLSSCYQ